ncbi:capsular biosynthesis protein [uncultured Helicobacter sp.]|uniref:capsular biosynthesis protein n=1 Tax=uncultured Helicobacter sp. TaxID=175537 RepID=UPI00374EB25B
MVANITILCDFDVSKRPRPARLIEMIKHTYRLSVIAKECTPIDGVHTFSFPAMPTAKDRTPQQNQALIEYCQNGAFEKLIFTPNRLCIREYLAALPPQQLLIVEDITLLPFALEYRLTHPQAKILIDLREYYPLEYENSKEWLESFGLFFYHLCAVYLPQVDRALCVSEGIARAYYENFGIQSSLFLSLPPLYDFSPTPLGTPIEILYHGFVSPDRSSQNLIELAHKLPSEYVLYAMVLSNQPKFLESLCTKAPSNLIFLPPVSLEQIVPFSHRFDIGLIPFFPTTFNLMHCLPNKFFEYIQARLCVVSTPLSEIKQFIAKEPCGVCSKDYSIDSLVETLLALRRDEIAAYKAKAHTLAYTYNMQHNKDKILYIIADMLGV